MTHFGKAMGTILMSTTAIVAADYVKPWVAAMLPPAWRPSPPAVVSPPPGPPAKHTGFDREALQREFERRIKR
ncbi:MAG: hypothetical protein P9F19_00290 [Candidatus Contendobacter sp.]|nr:hypothetical protein [Candidatus Contendobacter sp.]